MANCCHTRSSAWLRPSPFESRHEHRHGLQRLRGRRIPEFEIGLVEICARRNRRFERDTRKRRRRLRGLAGMQHGSRARSRNDDNREQMAHGATIQAVEAGQELLSDRITEPNAMRPAAGS